MFRQCFFKALAVLSSIILLILGLIHHGGILDIDIFITRKPSQSLVVYRDTDLTETAEEFLGTVSTLHHQMSNEGRLNQAQYSNETTTPLYSYSSRPTITSEHIYGRPTSSDYLWTYLTRSTIARRIAHYDDRKAAYGGPVLITFVYWNSHVQKRRPTHYGKVVYSNNKQSLIKKVIWKEGMRWPSTMGVRNFKLILPLDTNKMPKSVYICITKDCTRHSARITVFKVEKLPPKERLEFAVCLHQPVFRLHDVNRIILWIEMNRILGAQKFFIYYQELDKKVENVIQKYVDEGIVEAHDWFYNFTTDERDSNNFGQVLMITDCFYRSIYRVKYLVLHDLDELIIPRGSNAITWHDMIKTIDHDRDRTSYFKFCMTLFYDYTPSVLPSKLSSASFNTMVNCSGGSNITYTPLVFKRLRSSNYKANPWRECKMLHNFKHIIRPDKLKNPNIHGMGSLTGLDLKDHHVHPKIGLVHHYRISVYGKYKHDTIKDFTMLKYFPKLVDNASKRICQNY